MIDVYFKAAAKRRNSTLQADFTTSDVLHVSAALKTSTSEEAPAFLLKWTSGAFPYNLAKWGDHYYFVESVTFEANDLITVECSLDVLATYKAAILASTQFVAYSNISGGTWLPDRRIPIMASCRTSATAATLGNLAAGGHLILTCLGKNGCSNFFIIEYRLQRLLAKVQENNEEWIGDSISGAFADVEMGSPDTIPDALQALGNVLLQKDLLGNAYENAISCIRSCIWVPFTAAGMIADSQHRIWLGNYDTEQDAGLMVDDPYLTDSVTIQIPWQYTDWRRGYCEDIYLYLPLVGIVSIDTAQITNQTSLTITYSLSYLDGNIAYRVSAGDNIIGTYGAGCAVQIPLGINQRASMGQIASTLASGISKTVGGINLAKPTTLITGVGNAALAAYETLDTAYTTNPSVIGGMGGGAGAKLEASGSSAYMQAKCISVAHDTVIAPSDMAATMGIPTQKPLQLSGCSGFCQCINAHISAQAHGEVLNAIDTFVNSGFYIE